MPSVQEVHVDIFVMNWPSILGVILVNVLHACPGCWMLSGVSELVWRRLLFRQSVSHPFINFWLEAAAKDFSTFPWVGCTRMPVAVHISTM